MSDKVIDSKNVPILVLALVLVFGTIFLLSYMEKESNSSTGEVIYHSPVDDTQKTKEQDLNNSESNSDSNQINDQTNSENIENNEVVETAVIEHSKLVANNNQSTISNDNNNTYSIVDNVLAEDSNQNSPPADIDEAGIFDDDYYHYSNEVIDVDFGDKNTHSNSISFQAPAYIDYDGGFINRLSGWYQELLNTNVQTLEFIYNDNIQSDENMPPVTIQSNDSLWDKFLGFFYSTNDHHSLWIENTNNGDVVKYQTKQDCIQIEYRIQPENGLKEDIVISDNQGLGNVFVFDLKLENGMKFRQNNDLQVDAPANVYYFTDNQDRYVAHFLPLIATDNHGQTTDNIQMDILPTDIDDIYQIKIAIDESWLNSVERSFPVTIDPSIVHDTQTEFDTAESLNRTTTTSDPSIELAGPPYDSYGVYASDVLDLGTSSPLLDSLEWTENGVQVGGEDYDLSPAAIGHWKLNETSGTTASDSSGNGYNGTLYNMTTTGQDDNNDSGWTNDQKKFGNGALTCDGTNDFLSLGNISDVKNLDHGTVSAWVKSDSQGVVMSSGHSSNSSQTPYFMLTNYGFYSNYYGGAQNKISNYSALDNKWHLLTWTSDSVTQKFYIDGVEQSLNIEAGSNDGSWFDDYSTNTISFCVLDRLSDYGWMNGIMDDIRLYNYAISADEVVSLYNATNIEFQTRTGSDDNPYNGGWEEWKPAGTGTETQLDAYDNQYLYDENEAGLVAYWPMDESSGSTIDEPISSADATASETTIIDGKFSSARYFDGSNDYASISSSSILDLGDDFSIEAWVYQPTLSSEGAIISTLDVNSPNNSYGYAFRTNTNGSYGLNANSLLLQLGTPTWNWGFWTSPTNSFTAGQWHHVAVTVENATTASKTVYFYIDGVRYIGSFWTNNSEQVINYNTNNSSSRIGSVYTASLPSYTNSYFPGKIDELLVYNTNISSDLIQKHYLQGINYQTIDRCLIQESDANINTEGSYSQKTTFGQPKVDENTIALWHLDETGGSGAYLKDSSGNGYHGSPIGTTVVDGVSGKARDFNGSDYFNFSSSVASDMGGASAVTVEAWVNPDNASDYEQIFYTTVSGENGKFVTFVNSSEQFVVGGRPSSTDSYQSVTTTSSLSVGSWTHVVGVIDVANDDIKIYFNGVEQSTTGSPNFGNTTFSSETGSFHRIGYQRSSYHAYYHGSIDEVKVINRELSANEIAESYRLGRDHYVNNTIDSTDLSDNSKLAFYTASDQPGENYDLIIGESEFANYQPDQYTAGLWHLEEDSGSGAYIKDSSGNNNHGTPTNLSTVDGQVGQAGYFNGNARISVNDDDSLDFGTNPFTISAWVKTNYDGNYQNIYRQYTTTGLALTTNITDGVLRMWVGSDFMNGSASITDNEWHHVVGVRDASGNASFYIDGKLDKTSAGFTDNVTNTGYVGIGRYVTENHYPWQGNLDEVRVDNVARTPEEIRQAYEVGLRTHSITFDFAASLDNTNTISGSGDTSFTVDATTKGLSAKGEGLYVGDTIIIKENYNGTEYIAQGIVDAVNSTTGATTVASWKAGSTFPPTVGFTQYADAFKWQREYIDLTGILDDHLETTQLVTLRKTNGDSGSTIWLDDLNSVDNYMTDPAGTTINSTSNRYLQYRAILTTNDESITPSLSDVTINYNNAGPVTITGGSTSESVLNNHNKNSFNIQCNGVNYFPTSTVTCYASWDNTNWENIGSASSPISNGTIQGNPDVTTWTGYPATDGNYPIYVRAYADGDYTDSESFNIDVDRVEPTINSITSVGGDTTSPYVDTTDDDDTLIVYTTSANTDTCKWDTVDTDYDSMTNTCTSTSNCQVGEYGGATRDIYMRCIDTSGRKASSSYHLTYTQEWSNYVRTITLDTATSMNNYQVRVDLTTTNFNYSNVEANGSDIRFTDTSGNYLDYWIQDWNATGDSKIWVELPTSGTDEFYMYYGNGDPTSASSGDNTFLLFDDFNDDVIDTNKWSANVSASNRASITEASGVVTFQQQAVAGHYTSLNSIEKFGYNTAVEQRSNIYYSNPNNSEYHVGHGYGDGNITATTWGNRVSFWKPEYNPGINMQVHTQGDGSETEYSKSGGSGYHNYSITRLEKDIEWFVDDVSIQSHTEVDPLDNVPSDNLSVSNATYRSRTPSDYTWYTGYSVDWIFVRNFDGTDPVETLGDEGSAVTNLPAVNSVSSVAGDNNAPYIDVSDDGNTVVYFTTENDATNVKWDTVDTDYDSMSNDCGSATQCILDLTGEGIKTVYFRAIDGSSNKSDSSYELQYTIQNTELKNQLSSSIPGEDDLTLTVTIKPYFTDPITDGSLKLKLDEEFDFTGLTRADVSASGGDVTWTDDEIIYAGGTQIAKSPFPFISIAKAQGENSITFNFTGDLSSEDGEITFTIGGINQPGNPPTEGPYDYIVEWYEQNNAGGSPIYIQDGQVHLNQGINVSASIPTSLSFTISAVGSGQTVNGSTTDIVTTANQIDFGIFTTGENRIGAHDLAVSTNASSGFTVTIQASDDFTDGTNYINNFTGTNTTPVVWTSPPGGGTESYWGYTSDDSSLGQTVSDRFIANKWAGFTTGPVEIFYHDTPTDGVTTGVGTTRVGYQMEITANQPAGIYTTSIIYICTPTY